MKQKGKNIVAMDVGNAHTKILLGSFNEPINEASPFFELQGAVSRTKGVSKKGTINDKKKFVHSINRTLDDMTAFSGYDIDTVILSYTHPDMLFFKKTIGSQNIQNKDGIHITEKWLDAQKETIQKRIQRTHRHKRCTYFEIISLVVDGEEVIHDPYELTATKSLYITVIYLLVPATFIATLLESVEHFVTVRTLQPTAIANSALLTDEQKEQGIILCDVGGDITNVTAYRNGVIEGIRVIPFGGNHITAEIALLKKVLPEEAEQMKQEIQSKDATLKKQDIQRIDKKIGIMLKKELLSYVKELDSEKKFPNGIMLMGRGALYPNIHKIIEKIVGLHTFHTKTTHHAQSYQHTHQSTWHTAHAALYGVITKQGNNMTPYYKKTSFLQKITGFLHAIAKIIR